ncbi:MAG: BamA/TamA family outer membrane protein, partial [bacterium]|nr:BamA/TamA family outer membrane protein [bacterium]
SIISAPATEHMTVSSSGKDNFSSVTLSLQFDNRDWIDLPHRGWDMKLWFKRAEIHNLHHYYKYGIDLRRYQPLSQQVSVALRTATILSHGKIPLYDRTFFGYQERIRGHFYDVVEGENLLFNGVELRFPIVPIRYLNLPPVPGFEAYSRYLKFGVSGGIFYETGAVWFHTEGLNRDRFRTGFGAGVHFLLPYIDVFRIDLGFNFEWEPQLIAEIKTAF